VGRRKNSNLCVFIEGKGRKRKHASNYDYLICYLINLAFVPLHLFFSMHVACCMLRVACCVLRVACCVLRVACCVLRVACCVLRVACCVLRVACC
jgi:hypothetical protein